MIFKTYSMIKPNNNKCKEYNEFYEIYGITIKYNIIFNDIILALKNKLPHLCMEIKDKINQELVDLNNNLLPLALKKKQYGRDKLCLSISNNDLEIINKHFDTDHNKFLNFLTDFYQVIQLYSSFEGTVKEFIFRKKEDTYFIKQKDLIHELLKIMGKDFFNQYESLTGYKLNKNQFITLWNYYTNIRNLFAHSIGIISNEFIDKMNMIKSNINAFEEKFFLEKSILNIKKIFQLDKLSKNNLYIISEAELNIFRNFLIYIWETIYILETNNKKQILDKANLINNTYKFTFLNNIEIQKSNQKPDIIIEKFKKIYISSYKCPKCTDISILYKTLFNNKILISNLFKEIDNTNSNFITTKAFTCINCKSIFFPKDNTFLKDNLGMNIIDLDEDKYLEYLSILNNYGGNRVEN